MTLSFTWWRSKERFSLFLAKLRCFKHYLSKNNLYHFFLHEIRFWCSNLSKTSFGLFAENLSWFELLCTQTKTCFSCNTAERSLFTHTQKNTLLCDTKSKPALTRYKRNRLKRSFEDAVFCNIKLKKAQFRCQLTKTYFHPMKLKTACFLPKSQIAAFKSSSQLLI